MIHFSHFHVETIYIFVSLKPKSVAISLFSIQFLVQTTCSCPSFIKVDSIFCDWSARASVETLLLYAILISMAWWEGVDEIHLLIAPANYHWIPWPCVLFTCSTFTFEQHIFHLAHCNIWNLIHGISSFRGIWKKWYLIHWLDDRCNYRYWKWYVV